MNSQENKFHRRIRSFVRREGKITPGQTRAIEAYWPTIGCELSDGLFKGSDKPIVLEIGFGMGDSLLEMARQHPDKHFVGIEVYRPGVGSLLMKMEQAGVTNIRIFREDAIDVLMQCLPEHSLEAVLLFFPDPWHKKRHHKRRIVNATFINLVCQKLKPSGYFHVATDWENYAEVIEETLADFPQLKKQKPKHYLERPSTKYQKRGERLGHGVWDLVYMQRTE